MTESKLIDILVGTPKHSSELPFQTYERVFRQPWPGGRMRLSGCCVNTELSTRPARPKLIWLCNSVCSTLRRSESQRGSVMSDLTWLKIDAIRREIGRAAARGLVSPFQNLMAGMKVIEAPPPPPKVQVADIKFADGSSILDPAFRRSMNSWLAGRFGYQSDPFKDTVYMFGDKLIMSPKNIAMVRNLGP